MAALWALILLPLVLLGLFLTLAGEAVLVVADTLLGD
jgi:hypothetical protein